MKQILITGVTGMVGSHLSDFLIKKKKYKIFGLCRWRSPLDNVEHLIPLANKKKYLEFINGDLNDFNSLITAIKKSKPDYVFHLAAQSFPRTSFDEPIITFNTNINGTYNLLEALRLLKSKANVHICSSSEVFGRVSKKELPINENCRFHPASPYAISKVGTDLISKYFFEAYNMKTITTRMFTHTGPRRGDVFAESTFAKQIALIEQDKIKPVLFCGNLNSLRTFADVRDAVEAYYIATIKKPQIGQVFNIGGNYTCKIGDMLKYLISISTKKNIEIRIDKNRVRPIDADLQVPDIKKFRKATGWRPKYKFEETMKDLLNYWRTKVKSSNYLNR